MKQKILSIGRYICCIAYLILFIQILFGIKAEYSLLREVRTGQIVYVLIICIGIIVILKKIIKIFNYDIINILWVIWIALQIVYIFTTYSESSSDAHVVNFFAYWAPKEETYEFYYNYFSRYQNNIGLAWILHIFHKICGYFYNYSFEQSWIMVSILAAVLADIAIFFTVLFAKKYLVEKRYIIYTFLFSCLLIGLSEEGSILYSDIASLWTVPCCFYLLTVANKNKEEKNIDIIMRNKDIFYYACMGGILGIGVWLKPQVFIIFIAYAMFEIFSIKSIKKKVTYIIVTMSLLYFVQFTFSSISVNWFQSTMPEYLGESGEYMDNHKYPMIHWLNMGLNYDSVGRYNEEDVEFTSSVTGLDNKKEVLKESIKKRLISHSMKEWGSYFNDKLIYTLQNGSFSQEFVWKGKLLQKNDNAIIIQKYFVAAYDEYYNAIGVIVQIIYLMCIGGVSLSTIYYKDEDCILNTALISFIGILLFICLFESNVRYFYTFIPVIIVISLSTYKKLNNKYYQFLE